jgi:signal transduction histidine kinase
MVWASVTKLGGLGLEDAMWEMGSATVVVLAGTIWVLWSHLQASRRLWLQERRCREEMEAYVRLDTRMGRGGDLHGLAERVCRVVAARSPFRRVAMLVRDAEGRLYLAGKTGMDAEATDLVEQWAAQTVEKERAGLPGMSGGVRVGSRSLVVPLGEDGLRGVVIPLWTAGDRMVGALVVFAASVLVVRRRAAEEAVISLEALGTKLGRAMENAEFVERLLKAEKLAGLGRLAGGIAHELNNPLTVVTGFAELIVETTVEERVRQDAAMILDEARRMRETVESLQSFWRPSVRREEPVDLSGLVRGLAEECRAKLEERSIRLNLQVADGPPVVRGNMGRLRLVLEHLLNNAAQAIATARATPGAAAFGVPRGDTIRLTVSHDGQTVQVVVSDTGTGFREPERVFEPFYTTQAMGGGSGLGLSICYGIVREHEGEISAFNLHPVGAAVVVELPVAQVVRSEPVVIGEVA